MKTSVVYICILLISLCPLYAQVDEAQSSSVEEKAIKVFPNPATNVVNILGLKNSDRAEIFIIDTFGNTVLQRRWAIKNNALNIPIPTLAPGIYIVTINSVEQKLQVKFLKK